MDFQQLSPQVGTAPASGDLQPFAAGNSVGAASHERGFSSVLQAASQRVEARREAKSRASQAERESRSSGTMPSTQRGQSSKADGSRGPKLRASQSERENRSSSTTPVIHRSQMQKATASTDSDNTESRLPQTETDDRSSAGMSDLSMAPQQETASRTDTESQTAQSETDDSASSTMSSAGPLLISLVGATLVATPSQVDTTPVVLGSDLPTATVEGHSVVSESLMSQPATQPTEEGLGLVSSTNRTEDPAVQTKDSATGDIIAKVSPSTAEARTDNEKPDRPATSAEPSDMGMPLTTQQVQKSESPTLDRGFPIKEQHEREVSQTTVPSEPMTAQGQEVAQQTATMTTLQPGQKGEEVAAESDWLPEQQIAGKGELSLRQQHREATSSVAQAAAAERMPAEEQGFNPGAGGQKKDEGLKWLSHIDLQSAEVSSPVPQPRASEPVEGGTQYSSYQQGQGGTPPNIRSVPASSVPVPPQTNPLSPDAEPVPVPRTQAVQFDLSPADFGQLRVRVVLSDHTIHTHMSTDRAELGQMLTGQQEQLSSQLSTAGLDLGRFQVHVDQDRTNQSGQDWQSQAHQGPSQQRRESRSQDPPQDAPVPSAPRTGILSYFA
ncbi:MAG: flagellar hook-length control protein FliK [Nitrospirota bacterium]|nr:flagellar hook-length control protein FliK [Nitrospirota bacterium]